MHTQPISYASGDTELEGWIAWDPSIDGPRPGVVVAHAWRGRDTFADGKAEALARLGYVGFAADVYGRGRFAETDQQAAALMQPLADDRAELRARIGAAVHELAGHDLVDAGRIAAIGFCFGGLTVLELARGGAPVRGVVSFHGLLGTPSPADARHARARVLALHGHDDPLAPPADVAAFTKEMTGAGFDWQLVTYGHAMHAFTNPKADAADMGLKYDATADRRSWAHMQLFLDELFS